MEVKQIQEEAFFFEGYTFLIFQLHPYCKFLQLCRSVLMQEKPFMVSENHNVRLSTVLFPFSQ